MDPEYFSNVIQAMDLCSIPCDDKIQGPLYFLKRENKIFEFNDEILEKFFPLKVIFHLFFSKSLTIKKISNRMN